MIIISMNSDGTGLEVRGHRDEVICVLRSVAELDKLPASFDWDQVYFSSSVDFPEDETDIAEVIELCNWLRGG